jgi:hypothetical protein
VGDASLRAGAGTATLVITGLLGLAGWRRARASASQRQSVPRMASSNFMAHNPPREQPLPR